MVLTHQQRIERLRERLSELAFWTNRKAIDLDQWHFQGKPLALRCPWPTRDGVVHITHPRVAVPDDWPLEHSRLELDLGGECLLRLDYDDGTSDTYGLDPNHRRFPLGRRGFAVHAEGAARLPFGAPHPDPRIAHARLCWIEPDLEALIRRLTLVAQAAEALGENEVVAPLLACAEAAYYGLDWPSATGTYLARVAASRRQRQIWRPPRDLEPAPEGLGDRHIASVRAATEQLKSCLRSLRRRYAPQGAVALTGHAHLDLAWLWPMAETRHKATRSFHTIINLMDRYSDFRFNQSSAALYDFVEQDDPALFARIKDKTAEGQWEPIGGMWVEPDTNMPTGESLVRQLLYGQRYFERKFGERHTVCWLPDSFGFSPALPQILRLAGIDSFCTTKMNWSETNKMPYDLFWWEGLDGSRVLAHSFDNPAGGYNADLGSSAVIHTWRNFRGKHHYPESLLSFGYGDGGGGPTEEMIERQRALADFPAVPTLRSTKVSTFFRDVHASASAERLPVWLGEMYLELHRGTLTSQGGTKYLHRRAERDLIAAETLSSMSALLGDDPGPSLERQWRLLLRNQFHDILPGSSIREVYEQAAEDLSSVIDDAHEIIDARVATLCDRLVSAGGAPAIFVVNPDISARPLRLQTRLDLPNGQSVDGGSVLCAERTVVGLGATLIFGAAPVGGLTVSEGHLENSHLRIEFAEDGTLSRLFDKRVNREVLAGRGNQLWAYIDKPRNWDAWDIEEDYEANGAEIVELASRAVVERGPHRAALRLTRRFRDSKITQDIRLWANSPRVEFKTEIDWHDRRILLKARFPLLVRSDHATFECAFGIVRRPTHRNTAWEHARFEVAAHRFVDLSEPGYGVALLNDGKYGHHAVGNELAISLLRSPVYPDPYSDDGVHRFTYALYPHSGDWLSAGVLAEAEDLNRPLLCRSVTSRREISWQAIAFEGMTLGLGGFKTAEDGDDLILRVYEPAGARGRVAATPTAGWRFTGELNVLEERTGDADMNFCPFQIHTWMLRRAR